ncbi:MAG: DMT family transporter [Candidatus Eremiobacteraeota bacterium]|nr:DMT family transporter [Candidatus Eremiobacteraeota bacterium]MBV8366638.1 DMT family transporter [Candidatus Eremiobacteraeota bacterium]
MYDRAMRRAMTAGDWTTLLILAIIWSGSFLCYRILAPALAPETTVFLRLLIATLALLPFLGARARMLSGRSAWMSFAAMGALNNVIPFMLIAWAETRISAGLAAIINATTPMLGVIIAAAAREEPLRLNRAAGAFCGLAGVAVLLFPDIRAGLHGSATAQVAVLAASLSYAVAGVYGRRYSAAGIDPLAATFGQLCGAAALSSLLVLRTPSDLAALAHLSASGWAALAFLALPATSFAYVLYFSLLARAGATNALLVTLLVPVSAVVLAALLLGERLNATNVAGMAVILAGLLLIDGRVFAALARPLKLTTMQRLRRASAERRNTSQASRVET